jgi:hypothetical protein
MGCDPVIQGFQEDFDRYFDKLKELVEVCPDVLWEKDAGGYLFWQHVFHVLYYTEVYALPEGLPTEKTRFSREVAALSERPQEHMTKPEALALIATMKAVGDTCMASLSVEDLAKPNLRMTRVYGRPRNTIHGLLALVKHVAYHLGCCDSILRQNGLKGVC